MIVYVCSGIELAACTLHRFFKKGQRPPPSPTAMPLPKSRTKGSYIVTILIISEKVQKQKKSAAISLVLKIYGISGNFQE